jgi:hypothetical protein
MFTKVMFLMANGMLLHNHRTTAYCVSPNKSGAIQITLYDDDDDVVVVADNDWWWFVVRGGGVVVVVLATVNIEFSLWIQV